MKEFGSVDEILDFAMEREQEAHDFYMDLASRMDEAAMKAVFTGFAREELGHKKKLEMAKEGKIEIESGKKVQDLKIADYVVAVEPEEDMSYQDALILAMKKEKAAYRLYMDLADMTDQEEMVALFHGIAQEEAKHKLRFEVEYDEHILQWN